MESRFCAATAAVLCSVMGCEHSTDVKTPGKTPATAAPLRAVVVPVEQQPWQTVIRSQGSLVADEASIVGARVPGRVVSVAVDLGDFVHQADVVAQLDDDELKLQVLQAEAQLAQACAAVGLTPADSLDAVDKEKSPPVRQEQAVLQEARANLARLKRLQEQAAVTQADLEASAAAVAVAEARFASAINGVEEKLALIRVRKAELALAKDSLKHAAIRAPFDGLVQQRQASPGAYLSVGHPVVMLVRTDPLRFRGSIPERHALRLQTGQEVRVKLEGVAEPLIARVSRISPALEELSRSLTFEADLPNPDGRLRTGLFAEADVVVDTRGEALSVPASAVTEFAGVEKVWLVADGEARETPVQTGRRERGQIEIMSGVKQGDRILKDASSGRNGPIESPETQHGG
ncbi:MAG TPA: efflux RND transporter periplasmic adaptor subunit [Planctomycetaceae bacterium]|nr:efflux RND transporter periplasmic adaptor subunit [Planctomycetaceae bacterium]